jgi:DNA-binding CsgD family transcriptional regulator
MSVAAPVFTAVRPLLDSLEQSPDPLFVTDRRNHIVLWNKPLERLLGFTESEVSGETCGAVLCGSDRFGNRYCVDPCPVLQLANRGETVRRFELRIHTKTKTPIDVEVTILNLPAPPPYRFYLSHIVRPIDPEERASHPATHRPAAEGTDVRAQRLTRREVEVLGMLANGLHTAEIGDRLSISALTARNHVQNILEKLEVHSKSEAVAFAFRQKVI